MNRRDRRRENIRRRKRIRRCAREHDLIAERTDIRNLSGIALLGGNEEIAQPDMVGFAAGVWQNEERAVRTDWNFSPVRQRNVGVEIDRDLTRRYPQPEQNRFESERRNHFAAIAK